MDLCRLSVRAPRALQGTCSNRFGALRQVVSAAAVVQAPGLLSIWTALHRPSDDGNCVAVWDANRPHLIREITGSERKGELSFLTASPAHSGLVAAGKPSFQLQGPNCHSMAGVIRELCHSTDAETSEPQWYALNHSGMLSLKLSQTDLAASPVRREQELRPMASRSLFARTCGRAHGFQGRASLCAISSCDIHRPKRARPLRPTPDGHAFIPTARPF